MKFKAVIFDLFGTLVDDFVSSAGPVHMDMADALEVSYDQFTPLWNQTLEMRIVGAFGTVEANVEYVCNAMNRRPSAEQIKKAVEIRMSSIKLALQPKPDAVATLAQIKTAGYKTGLVSNASIEIPMLWQETAFADLIDTPIFSSRAHLRKPDSRIYHLACERLAVRSEFCLYVGDGEDHELAGAAKIGLHPVLIRNSSRQRGSRVHQETKDWQGPSIADLTEVLDILNRKNRE